MGGAMQLRITRDALDLVFRTLLTCGCPVTDDEGRGVLDVVQASSADEAVDYDLVLAVFKPNADTVFQRLAEFSGCQAQVGGGERVIVREHAIRYFASSYHWNHVVADGLDSAYKKVIHIPTWFLAHMLLPARVTAVDDDVVTATYEYGDGEVVLSNLFAPIAYDPRLGEVWAVHFAGLLDRLTPEEQAVASLMAEANPLLVEFRRDVERIDYSDFERLGDYFAFCRDRHAQYYD